MRYSASYKIISKNDPRLDGQDILIDEIVLNKKFLRSKFVLESGLLGGGEDEQRAEYDGMEFRSIGEATQYLLNYAIRRNLELEVTYPFLKISTPFLRSKK
ncbi:MAG: hypothetical protein ABIH72_01455 [archaeon]